MGGDLTRALWILALLWCAGLARAGEPAPHRLVELVPAQRRVVSPVVYLVDVSGSMGGTGAAAQALTRALSASDDGKAGLLAWGDSCSRLLWGQAGERRWLRLPDLEGVAVATRWLAALPAAPRTRLAPALEAALSDPEARSLVVISDGLWDDGDEAVRVLREARRRGSRVVVSGLLVASAGLGTAPVWSATRGDAAERLCRLGGGGLWEARR